MSRWRNRYRWWRRHQTPLLATLRLKARELSKFTGVRRDDLLQEGLCAAWLVPTDAIESAEDPIALQVKAAGSAMTAYILDELTDVTPRLQAYLLEESARWAA